MYMSDENMGSFFSDLLPNDFADFADIPMTDAERGVDTKKEIQGQKERKIQRRKYICENNLSVVFTENIPSPKPTVKCKGCGHRDLKLKKAKIHCKRKLYTCTKCQKDICSHCVCSGNICVNCSVNELNERINFYTIKISEENKKEESEKGKDSGIIKEKTEIKEETETPE